MPLSFASAATRLAALTCIPIIVALSLLPASDMVRTGAPHGLEHFVAYAGAAVLAVWATRRRGLDLVLVVTLFVALAGSLEYLQNWSDGREPKIANFLESAAGAVVGCFVGVLARRTADRLRRTHLAGVRDG